MLELDSMEVTFECVKGNKSVHKVAHVPSMLKEASLKRRAKQWAGLSGTIGTWEPTMEGFKYTPRSLDITLFIIRSDY